MAHKIKDTSSKSPHLEEATKGECSVKHANLKSNTNKVGEEDCVSHLKFLAALAHLRDFVSSSVGAFNIDEDKKYPDLGVDQELQNRLREKKWQVYVSRAVDRFMQWWKRVPPYKGHPTVMSLKRFEMDPLSLPETVSITLTKDDLPPLDVLMVWHTFMLNPRAYLEDCFRQARMNLWLTAFPLDIIASSITAGADNRYTYDPGSLAQKKWTTGTGRCWDNLDDPLDYTLICLSCQRRNQVPWTTAHITMLAARKGVTRGFETAEGYADSSFHAQCYGCRVVLNHDILPMLRFHLDNLALIHNELPLPGTLFNPNGVIESRERKGAKWAQLAPNYYFLHFKEDLLSVMKKQDNHARSMRNIADFVRKDLYKRDRKIKALDLHTDLRSKQLFGGETGHGRGALRRLMSRYWGGNSSIFALDLVGAVMRQGAFIEKMQILDWLHLPSQGGLQVLMHRFIQKYDVFWSIIVHNPSQMVVPTLDVDLVWHTHQLFSRSYYTYSLETTKAKKPVRFIDHNDKVDEGRLSESFAWTVKQYRKSTNGGAYSECLCWYCEATRKGSLFEKLSLGRAHQENPKGDTNNAQVHISSHNAVRSEGLVSPLRRKKLEKIIQSRHLAARESHLSKKKSECIERKNIFEVFAPEPAIHRDAYINNPSCFSVPRGTQGDCVAGTCSSSMAAGSCGGSTFASSCSSGLRYHGFGFSFVTNSSVGGAGGGAGCGGC